MLAYYLIANTGTLLHNPYAQSYQRQLMLTQMFEKDPRLMTVAKHIRKNARIILDNGEYEGFSVSTRQYTEVIKELMPQVVVLPDLFQGDAEKSRQTSLAYWDELCSKLGPKVHRITPMYVPQGRTKEENFQAFEWAIKYLPPKKFIIGFGKSYLLWRNSVDEPHTETIRERMIHAVMALPGAAKHHFHVLGARWTFTRAYGQYPGILGVDTYKPCRCALAGRVYTDTIKDGDVAHVPHHSVLEATQLRTNVEAFAKRWNLYNGPDFFAPLPPHAKQKN